MTPTGTEPEHIQTLRIEGIGSGGEGVGRLQDGRVVFVHRAAPGDEVRIELTRVKARWARGRLLDVIEPSPERRAPPCPFQARCGSCPLEHLEYEAQLRAKRTLVVDALERIGGLEELPSVEVHASPRELRYRNRVTFHLRRLGDGRVVAGFHELERPGRIVDVDGGCLLPEEPIARCWEGLRSLWGPRATRLPPGRGLRLTLRASSDGQVLLLVEGGGPESPEGSQDPRSRVDLEAMEQGARELVDEVPALAALWWQEEGQDPPVLLAGVESVEEQWFGESYAIQPGAFLQVNREAAEILHDLVLRELGTPRDRRVVDAYCGVGVYGRRMARHGDRAVGIEAEPGAAAMARERAPEGFTVLEGRVEDRLAEALPADLVILNPPRAGVAPEVVQALATAAPDRIVYVSCDPATLARDLGRLGGEYGVIRIQVVDLFPQTAHVETVITLERREGTGSPARA